MGISNGDGDGGGDRWIWLRGHFPVPAGCRNRDFMSPESPFRWRRRYGGFSGSMMDYLGFLGQRILIGEGRKVDGGQRGPHHLVARPGLARATTWCGLPVAPLRLVFWLRESSDKISTLAFVRSNSENIHFLTFWNQKQQRTGNWHCGILLIG